MDPKEYDRLSRLFVAAINKHQNMAKIFQDQVPRLLDTICANVNRFRADKGQIFDAKREKSPWQALIVHTRWPSSDPLGSRWLTLQVGDLGYFPGNGLLCGTVHAVLSNGDYFHLLKQAKVGAVSQIASAFSWTASAAVHSRQERALSAVEGIDRLEVDTLFVVSDAPETWRRSPGETWDLEAFDLEDYTCRLLDHVFNPEGKSGRLP